MNRRIPEIERLSAWINQAFGAVMARELGTTGFKSRYVVTGWANVNEYGNYNWTHIHPNNHWCGVYYVDTGDPAPSIVQHGLIEFLDPRPAIGVFDFPGITATGTWAMKSESGLMLMVPSWLRHSVLSCFGKGTRITIVFNLRVTELSVEDAKAGTEK